MIRSVDAQFGLDGGANKAARAWRFEPGRLNDGAVPVRIILELTFSLLK